MSIISKKKLSRFAGVYKNQCSSTLLNLVFSVSRENTERKLSTVSWRRRLGARLSSWRPGFNPRQIQVGLAVHNAVVWQIIHQIFTLSPFSIIPQMLHVLQTLLYNLSVVIQLSHFCSIKWPSMWTSLWDVSHHDCYFRQAWKIGWQCPHSDNLSPEATPSISAVTDTVS